MSVLNLSSIPHRQVSVRSICFLSEYHRIFFHLIVTSNKKVLLILVDGIPADALERAIIPNMNKILQMGKYKRAYIGGENSTYTQTPTISAPGYMTIITGTWGCKHNVYDNNVIDPNYHYKNIFRLLKEQQPYRQIAIFSAWVENRRKLVGEGLRSAGRIYFDYKFDGYDLDERTYPHDLSNDYIRQIDERVVNETVSCFESNAPDLSWVYLDNTDAVGHKFGDSPEFQQSIYNLDQQIGRISKVVESRMRVYGEEWLILITTDHGRDALTGKKHGEQSERERTTWIITNHNQTNRYFQDYTPAAVDLLPTMARFLELNIPSETARELDGVPFIGNVSLIQPELHLFNEILIIQWKALDNHGNVTVWLSTTNLFQNGHKDDYQLIASVPIETQIVQLNMTNYPSKYYKIVLEGQFNTVNKWLFL